MPGALVYVVVIDNRGYNCINRLQFGTGSAEFNTLLEHSRYVTPSVIGIAAHAGALGLYLYM